MVLRRIMEDRLQMTIEIDFNSDEALYIQLRNQIYTELPRSSIMKEMLSHRYASWQMKSALICIP